MSLIETINNIPESQRYEYMKTYLSRKARTNKCPTNASFELTPLCTLNCGMCYVRMNNEDVIVKGGLLPAEQWIDCARQTKEMGTLTITLTGGEAMTRSDYKYIYESIYAMGITISVLSNGTLINQEMVDFLVKHPPNLIQISMYGANSEAYERIAGNADAFHLVDSAIDRIITTKIPLILACTVTRELSCELESIKIYAKGKGLNLRAGCYISPARVDKERYKQNSQLSLDEIFMYEDAIRKVDGLPPLNRNLEQKDIPVWQEKGFVCGAGSSGYAITWDGIMHTCGIFDVFETFPLKVGLQQAWNELVEKVSAVDALTDCQGCKYINQCSPCPAYFYMMTGRFGVPYAPLCQKKVNS